MNKALKIELENSWQPEMAISARQNFVLSEYPTVPWVFNLNPPWATIHKGRVPVMYVCIPQIEICIDEKAFGTLWTKHNIFGISIYENDYNSRPDFKVDNHGENRYFNFTDDYGMNQ